MTYTAPQGDTLVARFVQARGLTAALAAPLSDADASVQPMPDASPAKWHLAHVTWFFETFVLRDHVPGYAAYDDRFAFLFNSYYEAEGARHPRDRRGMLTRPSLDEILAWRAHVDAAVAAALPGLSDAARTLVELGIHHEQQHQELLLTDILNLFGENPLVPSVWDRPRNVPAQVPAPVRWIEGRSGIVEIGHDGDGFSFDCEGPRHSALLHPHALADRPITTAEYRGFVDDGGYADPRHWLADGWAWVKANAIEAPLYWRRQEDGWRAFALDGLHPLHPAAPVTHVSYYEADAFARWAGARLPTEAEWESAAATLDPSAGNFLDEAGPVRPRAAPAGTGLRQMFGDVWEWTGSAYLPFPGFRPAEGAVGEYNGKFMSGQFVLRGGSCATPRGHVRASYRNFFYPHQRWQFTGIRLAKDL
ncbi:ergothioneine biosynthesis protein EgtB [Sphingomonas solaris]|uniref:Ergothioneine biosynthesis protein EgtB n=1 Tax=Alterirhizorhabdus solaris TaxID=2529389 RepID=A0A558QZY8_9SPHN|nr:ergothioneine biosynthesis protein EgtB [Sphingomonas solaris]TVV72648.1 ergothioneine biosynthesis protein EgtB [Sphingomonas solaris]